MANKKTGKTPKATEKPSAADEQKASDWLNYLSPYEPDFGQDEHGYHPSEDKIGSFSSLGDVDYVKNGPVHPDIVDDQLKPGDVSDMLALLEGFYGKSGQPISNYTAPPQHDKGPLVNIPLTGARQGPLITSIPRSRDVGPLINTPLPGKHTGPLINVPLGGVPKGPLINVAPSGLGVGGKITAADVLKLKAQLQAKAHGIDKLIA